MSNFVTVWTFTHPSEAYVVMGRLESEGIECYLVNELTTQVNPFYSNAVGGVKLQVNEEHLPQAIESLKASGYVYEEEKSTGPIYDWLSEKYQTLPSLGKLRTYKRVFGALILLVLVVVVIYLLVKPSLYETLTEPTWCVHRVIYKKESYAPFTNEGLVISTNGVCNETISFHSNGQLKLPGFSTREIHGTWRMGTRTVHIQTDTLQEIFEGQYLIQSTNNELTLSSGKTTIKCFKN